MSSPRPRGRPVDGDQRAITSLSERSGVPSAEVRILFVREFARLALGATVKSYLSVLTAANVRGMLHRARDSVRTAAARLHLSHSTSPAAAELANWEDEGGATARPSEGAPRIGEQRGPRGRG
jgi:hypothetical protein